MEVLKQWVCDFCGDIIETPEKGYVLQNRNDENSDYKIVHHAGCVDKKMYADIPCSLSLDKFVGVDGLVRLISMIDLGFYHMPEYRLEIKNMREFIELFRRVQIPYYEEARLYWSDAINDDYFSERN